MSDDLVKLEWDIRSEGGASAYLPFGSYMVEKFQFSGWQWTYCLYEYYDEGSYSCKDTADGMSLAEEHWRERVRPITKPLTDRIEELEANLEKALKALDAIRLYSTDGDAHRKARATIAELTGGKDE